MKTRLLLPLLAIAAAVAGFLIAQNTMSPSVGSGTTEQGTLVGARAGLKPFALNRSDGTAFTLEDLQQRWSMIFFGYTHCPDICPTTLADLRDAYTALGPEQRAQTQVLFVSVDPQRDTPEQLGNYVHYFHEDFIGLTGSDEQLENIAGQLYAVYSREPGTPESGYDVDHSSRILLINPKATLHAVFQHNQAPVSITAAVDRAIEDWN